MVYVLVFLIILNVMEKIKFNLILSLLFLCQFVFSQNAITHKEADGFVWKEIRQMQDDYTFFSKALSSTDEILIAKPFDVISYQPDNGGWFMVKNNDRKVGIYSKDGVCMVKSEFDEAYLKTSKNYSYIKVVNGVKVGVYSLESKEIVPIEYDQISLQYAVDNPYFECKNGNQVCAFDKYGLPLVSSLAYSQLFFKDGSFWGLDKNNNEVCLNIDEKGVKKEQTADLDFLFLLLTSSDSIKQEPASKTKSKSLLANGTYTQNSQGISLETGEYIGFSGPDFNITVDFYDDYIVVLGIKYDFSGMDGSWKKFSGKGLAFGSSNSVYTYYVDSDYNMKLVVNTTTSVMGITRTDNFLYTISKGDVAIPKVHVNNSLDNNISERKKNKNNNNNNRSRDYYKNRYGQKQCSLCSGQKKCTTCNGYKYMRNSLGNKVECPNCYKINGHNSGLCSKCRGTGTNFGIL